MRGVTVGDGEGVAVHVGVEVREGVGLGVCVGLAVCVAVGVAVRVALGVWLIVGVKLEDGVTVAVGVVVAGDVSVALNVGVGVSLGKIRISRRAVGEGVMVAVREGVGVFWLALVDGSRKNCTNQRLAITSPMISASHAARLISECEGAAA
jgi:hypothetical protein